MKFERMTNELYGARNAGYEIDPEAERIIDEDLMRAVVRSRGDNYVDRKLDELYDNDGDAYKGEDGNLYAVVTVYENGHEAPLAWQRLIHV